MNDRIAVARVIAYALPAAPLAALSLPLYIIVPTYYAETLGLPLATVGAVLLAVRIIDAMADPLIGWLADRWRPRFGRRRSLFALGIPIAGLAALMLFWPSLDAGALYLFGWATVLSLSFTALLLSYTAWGAELAAGYRERARITGYREAFTLLGTLVAIALPFAVGIDTVSSIHGLAMLGIVVALSLAAFGGFALWQVPEPKEYTIADVPLVAGLRQMAANMPFRRLVAAYLINGLANGIPATLFLYFVSQRLGAPEARGALLFVYFLSGLAGVPLAVWLAKRIGKHRAWCVAMLANCAVFAMAPMLGPGDLWPFGAICIATGVCLGFDLTLPAAIQADVIDVDTASSGEQRSGLYFAVWALATKLSLALAVGIVFPLLALAGFDAAPQAQNSEQALSALVAIYVWLPIAMKLAAVALMWRFPLDEAAHMLLRNQIETRTG